METFPRRGIELSTSCEVLFPRATHRRPAIQKRFENGSRSARFTSQRPLYTFVVTFKGAGDDFGTMLDFINEHGIVVPFEIHHPDLGTGTATFTQIDHDMEKVVRGNPPLYALEIPVEAVF